MEGRSLGLDFDFDFDFDFDLWTTPDSAGGQE